MRTGEGEGESEEHEVPLVEALDDPTKSWVALWLTWDWSSLDPIAEGG